MALANVYLLGIEILCVRPSKGLDPTYDIRQVTSARTCVLDSKKWNSVVRLKFIVGRKHTYTRKISNCVDFLCNIFSKVRNDHVQRLFRKEDTKIKEDEKK